MMTESSEYS